MIERTPIRSAALLAGAVLVAAACGSGNGTTGSLGNLDGSIFISGSSTVEPISVANAEKFAEQNPGVQISVEGPGTSDGFALFCAGDSDVQNASRPIRAEEIATCEENGIEFIEMYVGIDGLSVVTSLENTETECLSFLDLYALLGPESVGFGSWSDANGLAEELASEHDAEFGQSHAPYPDVALDITAPGDESGTYDSFTELVLGDISEVRAEAGKISEGEIETTRADYLASPDDNVIIEGVSGSPTSLGWVGYAFYLNNQEAIRAVPVDGGDGCVEPTGETIADGGYPIARPLFVYVNAQSAETNPALTAFIDFYMSDEGFASVEEVGYVQIPEDDREATRSAWDDRQTGTRQEG